jgi:NADH dehydrogenase
MILVAGATGSVGGETCRLLAASGREVKALTRRSSDPAKRDRLKENGVLLVEGDLKDKASLIKACEGVETVVSTASATISRSSGDNIESVDHQGQVNLVEAAKIAGVKRFIFISFKPDPGLEYPLQSAKQDVERRIQASGMDHAILRAGFFLEVWLSPAHGFDALQGKVRVLGEGKNKISWISAFDVAAAAAALAGRESLGKQVLEIAGDVLSPDEVVALFEQEVGREIQVEKVPEEALWQQYDGAQDETQTTFAGLMLGYARGVEMDPAVLRKIIGREPMTVRDFAHNVGTSRAALA